MRIDLSSRVDVGQTKKKSLKGPDSVTNCEAISSRDCNQHNRHLTCLIKHIGYQSDERVRIRKDGENLSGDSHHLLI